MSTDKKTVRTSFRFCKDGKVVASKQLLSKNSEKLLEVKVRYPKRKNTE